MNEKITREVCTLYYIDVYTLSIPKSTALLKISIETAEPDMGIRVLNELLALVSSNIEERLEIEKVS